MDKISEALKKLNVKIEFIQLKEKYKSQIKRVVLKKIAIITAIIVFYTLSFLFLIINFNSVKSATTIFEDKIDGDFSSEFDLPPKNSTAIVLKFLDERSPYKLVLNFTIKQINKTEINNIRSVGSGVYFNSNQLFHEYYYFKSDQLFPLTYKIEIKTGTSCHYGLRIVHNLEKKYINLLNDIIITIFIISFHASNMLYWGLLYPLKSEPKSEYFRHPFKKCAQPGSLNKKKIVFYFVLSLIVFIFSIIVFAFQLAPVSHYGFN